MSKVFILEEVKELTIQSEYVPPTSSQKKNNNRIMFLDVFRGMTMVGMILVDN